ncbi:hypothetical protein GCM10029992_25620 [Glycomyces albus]
MFSRWSPTGDAVALPVDSGARLERGGVQTAGRLAPSALNERDGAHIGGVAADTEARCGNAGGGHTGPTDFGRNGQELAIHTDNRPRGDAPVVEVISSQHHHPFLLS